MRTEGFFGTSDEDFAWAMQMNFFIALRATRAALTEMVKNGSGAIVNVASVNAFFQPDTATIDYGAAKAALVNLTKTLAQEFGPGTGTDQPVKPVILGWAASPRSLKKAAISRPSRSGCSADGKWPPLGMGVHRRMS